MFSCNLLIKQDWILQAFNLHGSFGLFDLFIYDTKLRRTLEFSQAVFLIKLLKENRDLQKKILWTSMQQSAPAADFDK